MKGILWENDTTQPMEPMSLEPPRTESATQDDALTLQQARDEATLQFKGFRFTITDYPSTLEGLARTDAESEYGRLRDNAGRLNRSRSQLIRRHGELKFRLVRAERARGRLQQLAEEKQRQLDQTLETLKLTKGEKARILGSMQEVRDELARYSELEAGLTRLLADIPERGLPGIPILKQLLAFVRKWFSGKGLPLPVDTKQPMAIGATRGGSMGDDIGEDWRDDYNASK